MYVIEITVQVPNIYAKYHTTRALSRVLSPLRPIEFIFRCLKKYTHDYSPVLQPPPHMVIRQ